MNTYGQIQLYTPYSIRNPQDDPEKFFFAKRFLRPQSGEQLNPDSFISPGLQRLMKELDETHGVIDASKTAPMYRPCDWPPLYAMVFRASNRTHPMFHPNKNGGSMSGTGMDLGSMQEAASRGLGEVIERFCNFHYPLVLDKNVVASYRDLQKQSRYPIFDITQYDIFSQEQKTKHSQLGPDPDEPITWALVNELSSDKKIYMPAQLLGANYPECHNEHQILQDVNSNGVGLGQDKYGSFTSAASELFERDAFMRLWLLKQAPQEITDTRDCDNLREIYERCERYGITTTSYLMNSPYGIPCVITAAVDDRQDPHRISLGMSCHVDIATAVEKSLREVLMVGTQFCWINKSLIELNDQMYLKKGIDLHERTMFCEHQVVLDMWCAIVGDAETVSVKDAQEQFVLAGSTTPKQFYQYCVDRSRNLGYSLFCYEYQIPWLEKIGVHVCRVWSPDLMSLHLKEHLLPLGYARTIQSDINTIPHPFL